MIPLIKKLSKSALFRVARDRPSGHLYYWVDGVRVFIRSAAECEFPKNREFALREVYFKHYLPTGQDCVVDVGAGLGTEIVGLARQSPNVKYIAVEIQPSVYECLALTLSQVPAGFVPFALAVGAERSIQISPTGAGIDAATSPTGSVPVEMIDWSSFVRRHALDRIDLLKMNIEGAEADLLEHADLSNVKRVIVSVHDFRADQGHGEHFRTRARVERRLREAGFSLTPIHGDKDWIRSWIFAERA